jgi:hypothetical protein
MVQFKTQPNVQVALVPFETNVKGWWPDPIAFARPDGSLDARIASLQNELGKGTDYQGALAYTYGLIASDIANTTATDPSLLPRTKYVVVFLTDGTPFPRCAANDNLTQYADDLNPDLTWADSQGAGDFCNIADPSSPDNITGFVTGTDRNQNYQLYAYINQLMALKDQFNIGGLTLNTVLLFNQQAVTACGAICQDLYGAYVRWPGPVPVADGPAAAKSIAKYLLQQMAQRGNGIFQEFNDFGGIGQLNLGVLDYSSLASRNVLKSLLVQPLSSEAGPVDRVVDSDGDGLPDDVDTDYPNKPLPTSPYFADTDGDGFDDAFEVRHADNGFRPDIKDGRGCDPASPLTPNCKVRDTDGDGLSSYAEEYLKTFPTLVDSDGDGIPDGLEVKYGLNPLARNAGGLDTDGDGVSDADEFRLGSNPIKRDNEYQDRNGFQYALSSEIQADNSVCYDFTISNVQLVTPPNRSGLRQGFNLFKVWFSQAPESSVAIDYGVWKAACVWAQYDPPSIRVPAGPSSHPLAQKNFWAPPLLNTTEDESAADGRGCVGISPVNGQAGTRP